MGAYEIVAHTTSGTEHVLQKFDYPPTVEDLDKWCGAITHSDFLDVDHGGLVHSNVRVLTHHIVSIERRAENRSSPGPAAPETLGPGWA